MFRTVKQRKKLCAECPIAKVADIIGDPCTLIVVRELLGGPKRFGNLESSLGGISSRTLTKKLGELQDNGIVRQKKLKTHTEYMLTKKGLGLHGIEAAMRKYGEKYL